MGSAEDKNGSHALVASEPDDPLKPTQAPELFFGLVGSVGADLDLVCRVLKAELKKVHYNCELIRLSELIRTIDCFKGIPVRPEDKRIHEHMKAGTKLREETGRGDILALMSVGAIRRHRQKVGPASNKPVPHQAYVLRSLKHPEEVFALRDIYGDCFFLISAYSPREKRVESLSKIIAKSHSSSRLRTHNQ